MSKTKGVFCLEGDWWNDLKHQSTVQPILELLDQRETHHARHIHRDVATREEFYHYILKWTQKQFASHPILVLAFHGVKGKILMGDQRKTQNAIDLESLGESLAGKCARRVIHFSACDTFDIHGHRLNRFLKNTGALAVSGYRKPIDWTQSAAFELIVLAAMQCGGSTVAGMNKIKRRIEQQAGGLDKALGFRLLAT